METEVSKATFSIVIPLHNEAGSIAALLQEIGACEALSSCEVVCVDDGSSDGTLAALRAVAGGFARLRLVVHARRCGQSAALRTGVEAAAGEWIITLDGDGQDAPSSAAALLAALPPGGRPALVCGHRAERRDDVVKRVSSRLARAARAVLLHDPTPDAGCGLKVFPRQAFLELPFFDHIHRYLPALMRCSGIEVISVPVAHRPRTKGASHYGIGNRLWATAADIVGVMWLQRRIVSRQAKEIKP
jgi:dolichol-phosphate mannosyltransferase